jgi:hypothetical protein
MMDGALFGVDLDAARDTVRARVRARRTCWCTVDRTAMSWMQQGVLAELGLAPQRHL